MILQYQKPMAAVLTALSLPLAMGVYCFGWRVLAVVMLCNLICFMGEYLFVRQQNKPVTMAALVTGTILGLIMPPGVPFWIAALGAAFSIVFGKMVFGGFGKNIFNPAMAGRCFLYIAFPLYLAGGWSGPIQSAWGGLACWTSEPGKNPVRDIVVPAELQVDGISGATVLAGTRKLARAMREQTKSTGDSVPPGISAMRTAMHSISPVNLLLGRVAGSVGETSAILLLAGLAYLLYRRAARWQLVVGPALGMVVTVILIWACTGTGQALWQALSLQFLAGGTMFALVFMTTEPVSAPMDRRAIWAYGILIGILAVIIREFSVFNEGMMFAVLLGNMFGPLIESGFREFAAWQKARTA